MGDTFVLAAGAVIGMGFSAVLAVVLYVVRGRRVVKRLRAAGLDHLTGLANRRRLDERLGKAMAQARRDATQFAILFVDLDGFKEVNDRFGHAAGDALLTAVGRRL